MVLSETEAEKRLTELRRQREAIDRAITDLTLYLELGRRLSGTAPAVLGTDATTARSEAAEHAPEGGDGTPAAALRDASRAGSSGREKSGEDGDCPSSVVAHSGIADAGLAAGAASDGGEVSEGALARRYGRALIAAAVEALEEAGRPLHASEILARLSARGYAVPGHDPVAALNTRLWKRSGPGGPVRRLGDAVYSLPDEGRAAGKETE